MGVIPWETFSRESLFGDISLMDGFDADVFYGSGGDPFAPLAYLINYPQKVIFPFLGYIQKKEID